MARRKVLKITPILVTLNILVLLLIICYYSFRLVKYYKLENGTTKENETVLLVKEVLKKQSYVDLTQGLIHNEEDNTYTYLGDIDDNYIEYSGNLFRIIGVDSSNNIRAVSENSLTLMYSGLEKGYNDSYVNKWLNVTKLDNSGVFENTLYDSKKILTTTDMCSDVIDDLTNITCNEINKDNKITLLSLYDYAESGGKSGFLNNGENYYLSTLDSNNNNYYINSDGEVGINQVTTKIYGVRPVITINSQTILLSGNGTKDNPYKIESHDIKTLNDVYVGNYIEFNNDVYKVINKYDDTVRVAATSVLKNNEENLLYRYCSTNLYNYKSGVGKYLNYDFYEGIPNNDLIKASYWYIGKSSLANLDYSNMYSSKSSAYIGFLALGDLYVNDLNNIFTLTPGIESDEIINVITQEGNIYGDSVSSKYNIRIAFNLDNTINISNGIGTIDSPYVLGVDDEKEE